MPRPQGDITAAALLGTWTDSDTAMQIVGTSLGIFGPGLLEPERALSNETPLRNALFDALLSLVEGGALDMRPTDDGLYAFRWRPDYAVAGLTSETASSIDIDPPSPYLAELVRTRRERDEALGRAQFAEALAEERERLLRAATAAASPKRAASRRAAPKAPAEIDLRDDAAAPEAARSEPDPVLPEPDAVAAEPDAVVVEPAAVIAEPDTPAPKASKAAKAPRRKAAATKPQVAPEPTVAAPEPTVAAPRATTKRTGKAKAPTAPEVLAVDRSADAPVDAAPDGALDAVTAPEVAPEATEPTPQATPESAPAAAAAKPKSAKSRSKRAKSKVAPVVEPEAEPPSAAAPDTSDVVYLTQPEPVADIDLTADDAEPAVDEAKPRRAKWSGYTLDKPRSHLSSVERLADEG